MDAAKFAKFSAALEAMNVAVADLEWPWRDVPFDYASCDEEQRRVLEDLYKVGGWYASRLSFVKSMAEPAEDDGE